jgi:hypothetical protein
MEHLTRTGALVQIIDILGHEQHLTRKFGLQTGQGGVR